MNKNKKNVIIIVAIVLLIMLVIGLTYAIFQFTGVGSKSNQVTTTNVTMSYSETTNGITLTNAMPMSDALGMALTDENQVFEFTVSIRTGSGTSVAYEVSAEKISGDLGNNDVKLYLEKSINNTENYEAVDSPSHFIPLSSDTVIGSQAGEMLLDIGSSTTSVTYNYKLRMWVDEDYEVGDVAKSFTVKINVYGKDGVTLPTSVSLNKNTASLFVGNTDTLTATVTPSSATDTITWASSDSSIATVSNSGVVTGVSAGTATITAKTINGKVASCMVTVQESAIATSYLASIQSSNTDTMIYDGTTDNNLRYTGANPNNYVTFNGESAGWRIVGVFGNNIKLVRDQSIGNWSWDSSASGVNSGKGVNDWTQADLMATLNSGAYWSRIKGTCYNGANNATGKCNFSSIGLISEAQNMIASTTWYLGGADWSTDATTGTDKTALQWYSIERGSTVYNCSTDDGLCPRKTTWTGKVGLLYPSDYGYASSACNSSKVLIAYSGSDDYRDSTCTSSNWLFLGSYEWLISPISAYAWGVWGVYSNGNVGNSNNYTYYARAVRPAVYLDSSVTITGGIGTSSDPYTLG